MKTNSGHKSSSKNKAAPQLGKTTKPIRTKTEGRAGDLTHRASDEVEIGRWTQMRRVKMASRVDLSNLSMARDTDHTDEGLCIYLAHIMTAYSAELWSLVFSKVDDDAKVSLFGDVMTMAGDLAGHQVGQPFPLMFSTPGLAGVQPFGSVRNVLFWLSLALNDNRDAIRLFIIEPKSLSKDAVELLSALEFCEALVIAQAAWDRESSDAETEACERRLTSTWLTKLANHIKASYYRLEFDNHVKEVQRLEPSRLKLAA